MASVRAELRQLALEAIPFLLAAREGDQALAVLRIAERLPEESDALVLAVAPRLADLLRLAVEVLAPARGAA